MDSFFYGVTRESSGKLRIWEINDSEVNGKTIIWGHRAHFPWMIREIFLLIRDLYCQFRYMKQVWNGKELDKGNKKMAKYWGKQIKNIKIDLEKLK